LRKCGKLISHKVGTR